MNRKLVGEVFVKLTNCWPRQSEDFVTVLRLFVQDVPVQRRKARVDRYCKHNLPTELAQKVTAILQGKDPQSAVGKACLFLEAQPTAGTFTVPYTEGTTAAEQVSQMLFLALKTLANLTIGGLELHRTYGSISINLALLGVVEEVGHTRDWPINANQFGILFSIPTLGSVLTSLNLSNANLKAGLDHLVKALPGYLVLKELNISYNNLGAYSIKPILSKTQ